MGSRKADQSVGDSRGGGGPIGTGESVKAKTRDHHIKKKSRQIPEGRGYKRVRRETMPWCWTKRSVGEGGSKKRTTYGGERGRPKFYGLRKGAATSGL